MTKLFCSKTNQAVTLTVLIADSGEAKIWQTDRPGLLAKIYHVPESHEAEKLAQMKDRVAKLEVMVKRVPKDPNAHQNHISFAWPRSLLKNSGGEVVGFLMSEVENSLDLLKVCTPRMRKSLGVDANWYFLHVVARNIAGIIQAIHDEGYVLGDIKLQNILVNNRALPTIIDTDSFQVVDPIQNKVYRCLVASEGFTPSELIGKDIDSITQSAVHDRFRLGVVIYYLLFGGPPFRGNWQGSGDPPEQVELIRRGLWPYAPNSLIQPNHNTIPLDIIHPELQRCFLLCFNEGHFNPSKRPSARVWLGALEVAFNELQSCGKVDSHFYGLSYGRCYWCDRAQSLGIDIFQEKSMVKPQPLKPLSSTSTKPLPTVVKPIIPNPPITYQPSAPKLFLTRRKILVGMGLLGTGGAITWIGSQKPQSTSFLTPSPTPTSTQKVMPTSTEMLPGGIKLEMITIPAGKFLMGSPDSDSDAGDSEKPQHEVELSSFLIGKYPVTQEQYEAVMGNNPSLFKDSPKNPVEQVRWNDAQEFCKKLNQKTAKKFRLPSEAEWEYACRAGTQTRFYFGDDEKQLGEYAWYLENSSRTYPVGQKNPNNWGLYDMSGNVWEW
ncbi:MAG: SUMF1/EgtB/PvdO family nonheme iron enzyme, partial [Snowella sp.]